MADSPRQARDVIAIRLTLTSASGMIRKNREVVYAQERKGKNREIFMILQFLKSNPIIRYQLFSSVRTIRLCKSWKSDRERAEEATRALGSIDIEWLTGHHIV